MPQKHPKRGRLWLYDGSCIRPRPEYSGHVWAYDLVEGRTHDGRKFRILTIIVEASRECLALIVARQIKYEDVLAAWRTCLSRAARLPISDPVTSYVGKELLRHCRLPVPLRFTSPPGGNGNGGNNALTISTDHSLGAGQRDPDERRFTALYLTATPYTKVLIVPGGPHVTGKLSDRRQTMRGDQSIHCNGNMLWLEIRVLAIKARFFHPSHTYRPSH